MTKLLTISTLAILAILLIAVGVFSFPDKQTPTPIVNDPAYVAAIAPPTSTPPSAQRLLETPEPLGGEGEETSDEAITPNSAGDDQPTVDARAPSPSEADPAEISSSDATTDAYQEAGSTMGPETATTEPKASGQPPRTYTVLKGDNLALIARKLYGDPNLWAAIAAVNPSVNPSPLQIDQVLQLPTESALSSEQPDPGQTEGGPVKHQIQPGDSLSSIAGTYYGDPTQWRRIRDENREVLGKDLKQLRIGRTLTIPK